MHISILAALAVISTFLAQPTFARAPCTYERKVRGIQHEIDTINSHSFADARKIPLAPFATRDFYVTPNESPDTTVKVNTGKTASTVRAELVSLATFLNASIAPHSLHYIKNANGTVTSDFLQYNRIVLPEAYTREVHEFNSNCQITKITGYTHSSVSCPSKPSSLRNKVLVRLCKQLAKGKVAI